MVEGSAGRGSEPVGLQEAQALVQAGELSRLGLVRSQHGERVSREECDTPAHTQLLRFDERSTDELLVTAVYPVELSERDDASPEQRRHPVRPAEDLDTFHTWPR